MMEDYEYLNVDNENALKSGDIDQQSMSPSQSGDESLSRITDLTMEIAVLREELAKKKHENEQLSLSMKTKVKYELSQRVKISELEAEAVKLSEIVQSKEKLLTTTNTALSSCKADTAKAMKQLDKKDREIEKLNKQIQQHLDAIHIHKAHIQKLQEEQASASEKSKLLHQENNQLTSSSTQLTTQLTSLQNTLQQTKLGYESKLAQFNYTQLIQRKQIEVLYEELSTVDPNNMYAVNTRLGQVVDTFNRSAARPEDLYLFCPSPSLSQVIQTQLKPDVLWREYQSDELVHHTINMGILGAATLVTVLVLCVLFGCARRTDSVSKNRASARLSRKQFAHTISAVTSEAPPSARSDSSQVSAHAAPTIAPAAASSISSKMVDSALGSYTDATVTEPSIPAVDSYLGAGGNGDLFNTSITDKYASTVSSGSVTPKFGASASASVSRAVTPVARAVACADRPDSRAATPPSHKSSSSGRVSSGAGGVVDSYAFSKTYSNDGKSRSSKGVGMFSDPHSPAISSFRTTRDEDAPTPVIGRSKVASVDDNAPTPVANRFPKSELEDMPTPVMSKVKSSGIEDLPTPVTSKIKSAAIALEDLPTPDTFRVPTARYLERDPTEAGDDSGVNTPVVHKLPSHSVLGLDAAAVDEEEVTPRLTSTAPGLRDEDLDFLRRSIDEQFRQAGTVSSQNSPRSNSFALPREMINRGAAVSRSGHKSDPSVDRLEAESQSVTPKLIRSPSQSTKQLGGADSATSSGSVTPRMVSHHSRSVSRDRSAVRGHPESESREVTPRFVRSDSKQSSPQMRHAPEGFDSAHDTGSRSVTPRLIKTHSSSRLVVGTNDSKPPTIHRTDAPPQSESLSRSVTPRVVRSSSRSHTPAATKVSSHSRGSSGGSVYSQLVDYDDDLPTSRSVTPRLQKSSSAIDRTQSRADSRADSRSETPVNSAAYRPATQYAHSGVDAVAIPSESSSRAATPVLTRGTTASPRAIPSDADDRKINIESTSIVPAPVPTPASTSTAASAPTLASAPASTAVSGNTPSAHVKALISNDQHSKGGGGNGGGGNGGGGGGGKKKKRNKGK